MKKNRVYGEKKRKLNTQDTGRSKKDGQRGLKGDEDSFAFRWLNLIKYEHLFWKIAS